MAKFSFKNSYILNIFDKQKQATLKVIYKMGSIKQHKLGIGIGNGNGVPTRCVIFLCFASFFCGYLVVNRTGKLKFLGTLNSQLRREVAYLTLSLFQAVSEPITTEGRSLHMQKHSATQPQPLINCDSRESSLQDNDIFSQVSQTHNMIMNLDKTMSTLEMQLAAERVSKVHDEASSPTATSKGIEQQRNRPKVFFVMGIMTAFSSRKRRDSIRETWMPQGEQLQKLKNEKGLVVRFVIGHSASPGGVLDRAIDAEEAHHKDFFRLDHVEGYHELSMKTQLYFSTAVANWDADFYIKVDDDVHVNLGMVVSALARQRSKPRIYIGCMKSGLVLSQKGVKYHEPEFWKFGEDGNNYFRHATGQLYALSKDLATYISVNKHVLHRYANEDVSLGSWLIGLDVNHIDDRSLCCGTPFDCEWKAQAGNPCAASFDWSCSGICKSVERMMEVHQRCGEGADAIWHADF